MNLPTKPQSRASLEINPLAARVMLAGLPKIGKSSLLAEWAPKTTLIIDTHRGTTLLEGEHFVQHVATWPEFEAVADEIASGDHSYKTIGIDLVDDIYKLADAHVAGKKNLVAAGLIEYGKGVAEAEGLYRRAMGKLIASPYGIWFISHIDTEDNQGQVRYVPRLDKRVRTYTEGVCQFIFLAEALGKRRQLHTAPAPRFQAGSRVPLPDVMPLDARELYAAIQRGLSNGKKGENR